MGFLLFCFPPRDLSLLAQFRFPCPHYLRPENSCGPLFGGTCPLQIDVPFINTTLAGRKQNTKYPYIKKIKKILMVGLH